MANSETTEFTADRHHLVIRFVVRRHLHVCFLLKQSLQNTRSECSYCFRANDLSGDRPLDRESWQESKKCWHHDWHSVAKFNRNTCILAVFA